MSNFFASREILSQVTASNCDIHVLVIQHIREDTYYALNEMIRSGIDIVSVIAISYSVQEVWVNAIGKLGIDVKIPPYSEIPQCLRAIITKLRGKRSSIIVLDVGGYAVNLAQDPESASLIRGIVEETNQGLWRYLSAPVHVPVVQVARCRNKKIENVYVGRAIVDALGKLSEILGFSFDSFKIGIIGYGEIGENATYWLRKAEVEPIVFDINPFRQMLAISRGLQCLPKGQLLASIDLILGCTGRDCILYDEIPLLKSGTILVSGSSKRVEFASVLKHGEWVPEKDCNYVMLDRRTNVRLLCDGEPINFRFDSLPLEIGDFMFSNVFGGVLQILRGDTDAGVSQLSTEIQDQLTSTWVKIYTNRH